MVFTVPWSLRQAKEKSKGTWVEKPLNELENECKTDEDRTWLAENIVASSVLSLLNLFNISSISIYIWGDTCEP